MAHCFDTLIPAVTNAKSMKLSSREACKQMSMRVYECKSVEEKKRKTQNKKIIENPAHFL